MVKQEAALLEVEGENVTELSILELYSQKEKPEVLTWGLWSPGLRWGENGWLPEKFHLCLLLCNQVCSKGKQTPPKALHEEGSSW